MTTTAPPTPTAPRTTPGTSSGVKDRHSTSLVWYHIPLLEELYERGGIPGEVYALVSTAREFEFQQAQWGRIPSSPTFKLVGPKGSIDFLLMRSLTDPYIPGLRPEAGRRLCHYDPRLEEATGLTPGDTFDPGPSAKSAKGAKGAKAMGVVEPPRQAVATPIPEDGADEDGDPFAPEESR